MAPAGRYQQHQPLRRYASERFLGFPVDADAATEAHEHERGTIEYNIALGERRAQAAIDYLASLGVPKDRLKNVSYGKEVPVCSESSEACWQQNRRAKPTVTSKAR